MTNDSERRLHLLEKIAANQTRHCNLLKDNRAYYFNSVRIWWAYNAQREAEMDSAQHLRLSEAEHVGFSEKSPNDVLRDYLRPSVFKNFLSIYELFINNLLSLWLKAHPGILNERSISFRDFYHASSKERVIDEIIEREIIGILYKNPRDVIHFIYRKFLGKNYCDSLTHDMIAGLAELKALRDVLEHNDGRINKPYLEKAGDKKRGNDGESIEISDDILLESYELLTQMMEIISSDFRTKLETNP
jgi:hypothetical protein